MREPVRELLGVTAMDEKACRGREGKNGGL